MDIVGFVMLRRVTGLGGGIIRNIRCGGPIIPIPEIYIIDTEVGAAIFVSLVEADSFKDIAWAMGFSA